MGICRLILKAQSVIKSFPADPAPGAAARGDSSRRDRPNEAERDDNGVPRDPSVPLSSPRLRSLQSNLCDKLVPDRRRPSPDIIDRVR